MSQRFYLGGMAVAGLVMLGLGCVKGTEIVDGQVVIIEPVNSPDASADPADASRAELGPAASTPPGDSVAPRSAPAAPSGAPASGAGAPGGNAATPSVTPAPGANAASNGTTVRDAGIASPATVAVVPPAVVPPAVVDAGVRDAGSPS